MTEELIIYGLINILVAGVSGASGGGGGLVTTPLLIILGLSPATALATAKFGGFGISLGTSSRFYNEKITDKKAVIVFTVLGVVGALIGSLLLVQFSDQEELLQRLIGVIILLVGVPMLYWRHLGLGKKNRSKKVKSLGLILLMISVIFQAAVGAGSGIIQMTIFMSMFGMTALVASATRRSMQVAVTSISLFVFIVAGLVDYQFGIVAFITALIGGYGGAHLAIKKGDKFIINILAISSALMALYMIFN